MKRERLLLVAAMIACDSPPSTGYDVPIVTGDQLASQARSACEAANRDGKPVLLEFGAEWCPDCQAVARLSATQPFVEELGQWVRLSVNVGRFDQHARLLEHFTVEAIAAWVALVPPADCSASVESWAIVRSRAVEPSQGDGDTALAWLQETRAAAASVKPRELAPVARNEAPVEPTGEAPGPVEVQLDMTRKAVVWIDGKKIGKFRSKRVELSPGTHTLRIKAGKRKLARDINVAGEGITVRYDHRSGELSVSDL